MVKFILGFRVAQAAIAALIVFGTAKGVVAQIPPATDAVFLKAFYPLDEPRFHCVDIPGHRDSVDVTRPLSVHTCKEGIWHKDALFDSALVPGGALRMPEYNLCLQAASAGAGARLILQPCSSSPLQNWHYANFRLVLKAYPDKCLTIGEEPSSLTPGGKRLPSKHMARSLSLSPCSEAAFQRQMWRFEKPQKRSGSILPLKM